MTESITCPSDKTCYLYQLDLPMKGEVCSCCRNGVAEHNIYLIPNEKGQFKALSARIFRSLFKVYTDSLGHSTALTFVEGRGYQQISICE